MNRGRARRGLVAAAGLFALSQLLLNGLADTARPGWRDPEFGVRIAHAQRAAHDGPVVVALGSSRTQMGLDPDSVGDLPGGARVQVMAQAGGRAAGQLIAYERLRRAGVRPRAVLIEILPPALADQAPTDESLVVSQLSAADLRVVTPYLADAPGVWAAWARGRAAPVHTFRSNLLSTNGAGHLLPTGVRTDFHAKQTRPTGWMPYFFERVSDERRAAGLAAARAQYAPLLADFRVRPGPAALLAEVARRAHLDGAAVAFVVPPEGPAFRSWYPSQSAKALTGFYGDLMASCGTPVFDCRESEFTDVDFADGHHLLRHAARAYSERLGRECLGPWLAGS